MASFVSRGGEKLQEAIDQFNIPIKGMVCADFGASTGGFTDCLLQAGAQKVYAVEVGYGTLDWKLRNDPSVVVMERTNAMHVNLPEKVDILVIDAGWTKQKMILPNAFANLKSGGSIITLIKPHYEAPRGFLKAGKVIDEEIDEVLELVKKDIEATDGKVEKIIESPILGGKGGNREFLALVKPI